MVYSPFFMKTRTMEKGMEQLIAVSQLFGKNPLYVIAGGGNTSFKTDDKLWIKASGSALATIDESGFVCLSREGLAKIAKKVYPDNSTKREEEVKNDLNISILYPKDKRPSVETSLHEIIDYAYVVHTHPTLVNALMCAVDAEQQCLKIFGTEALFIEYTDPGYILFKKVYEKIEAFKAEKGFCPKVIFLENHGVFVAADTCEEIEEIYNAINTKLKTYVNEELPAFTVKDEALLSATYVAQQFPLEGAIAKVFSSALISKYISSKEVFSVVDTAFTPDGIVYCKAKYPFVETEDVDAIIEAANAFNTVHGFPPKAMAIKEKGLLVIEDNEKSVNTVAEVYTDMLKIAFYAENFGGSKPMTDEQIAFIDNWEVENYRRKIAKS
ncbi:MAG: class II aldolase/adducin family protein, partial [Bacteroidales bacterium]|jgi:rhamnose utilization protein RhaD (predicted bifunctional aldolase and dehydrogenase)|nr:class II aldolase/adducin family protein [Bacteroidales bacterium]